MLLREFQHIFTESGQPMLHYISPERGWSKDWAGYYITRWLQKLGMQAYMASKPPRVKGDIVHFADIETLFDQISSKSNDHNWLVATIAAGDLSEDNPEMQEVLELTEDLNKLVVTNETMFERFEKWGVRSDKLVCIPNGVDLNVFFPSSTQERNELRSRFGIPEEAFCIGSFQKDGLGWEEGDEADLNRGPDVFLETIHKLKSDIPSLFVFLSGPARGYVKQGLEDVGVSYIHEIMDPYQEMRDCYACLDAYLITSRGSGGPNALLESMACGVPVVSTEMGMAKDVIGHEENGLLAPVEDSDRLAELVKRIHSDPELVDHISAVGIDTAREYDWQVIAELYFEHVYAPLMVQRYS